MEQKHLISIIIPCYNDWQYVEQAVKSALNQTYPYKEVIVIDDGSDAKTKAVLNKLEPKITKLITQENQGQSNARNIGIKTAKGEFILVLDSDDFIEPNLCSKSLSLFLNDTNIKLVSYYANLIFDNNKTTIFKPSGGTINDFLFKNAALGTSIFKKLDWLSCGGYDENMRFGFEDWEFFIRLLKDGGYTEIVPESLYNYRKRNNSTTFIANSKKYELWRYIYFKHKDLYKENFDFVVIYLLNCIAREEIEKNKIYAKLDYRIGFIFLKPFRVVKKYLNF